MSIFPKKLLSIFFSNHINRFTLIKIQANTHGSKILCKNYNIHLHKQYVSVELGIVHFQKYFGNGQFEASKLYIHKIKKIHVDSLFIS